MTASEQPYRTVSKHDYPTPTTASCGHSDTLVVMLATCSDFDLLKEKSSRRGIRQLTNMEIMSPEITLVSEIILSSKID